MFKFVLTLLFITVSSQAKDCRKIRGSFDIGSEATRLKVAEVDVCEEKVVRYLYPTKDGEGERKVSYKEAMKKSGTIDNATLAKGTRAIKELIQEIKDHGISASGFVGTASASFRDAANGKSVAAKITKQTGVKVTIIDQDLEARLGFYGVLIKDKDVDAENIVVWDIGGATMQLATLNKDGKSLITFLSPVASKNFSTWIACKKEQDRTPNPISQSERESALSFVRDYTHFVNPTIKAKLKNPKTKVYGIGGVHYYSIRGQLKKPKTYNGTDLEKLASRRVGLTDDQIGGKYAATDVSNILLVLGFVDALKMKEVTPIKVNLADGALLYPKFW